MPTKFSNTKALLLLSVASGAATLSITVSAQEFYGAAIQAPPVQTQVQTQPQTVAQVQQPVIGGYTATTGLQGQIFRYRVPTVASFAAPTYRNPVVYTYRQQPTYVYRTTSVAAAQTTAPAVSKRPVVRRRSAYGMNRLMNSLRPYVALRAGLSRAEDTSFATASSTLTAGYENGLTGVVAFGVSLSDPASPLRMRLEAEVGGNSSEVTSQSIELLGNVSVRGEDDSFGTTSAQWAMMNAFADFGIGGGLSAFLGGGIGAAQLQLSEHGITGDLSLMDDDDTVLAYQGSVGLAYDISPSLAVEGSYRYQGFGEAELEAADGRVSNVEASSHNFLAGIRLSF